MTLATDAERSYRGLMHSQHSTLTDDKPRKLAWRWDSMLKRDRFVRFKVRSVSNPAIQWKPILGYAYYSDVRWASCRFKSPVTGVFPHKGSVMQTAGSCRQKPMISVWTNQCYSKYIILLVIPLYTKTTTDAFQISLFIILVSRYYIHKTVIQRTY